MTTADLSPDEYFDYYAGYVRQVPGGLDIDAALVDSLAQLDTWLARVPASRADYAYAPGKWTVAQCLQHIIDSERVFAYRALVFGRGDAGPLPGFEQDDFVAAHGTDLPPLTELREELRLVRETTRRLFSGFRESGGSRTQSALELRGTMSGHVHSVRAIGYICAGHTYHHARLYEGRYGAAAG